MKNENDLESLIREGLQDADVRAAFHENGLRRAIGAALSEARLARGLSVRDLAQAMRTSPSQVQRLLHQDVGGSISLRSLCRAADVLGLRVGVHLRASSLEAGGNCVAFPKGGWTTPVDVDSPAPRELRDVPREAASNTGHWTKQDEVGS
jgi:transcriptional regulator with XRE-family HTH domain